MKLNNNASRGRSRVDDGDLQNMLLNGGKILPWLPELLEEVQYLRNEVDEPSGELGEQQGYLQRIEYLESVLDKLGATYEKDASE